MKFPFLGLPSFLRKASRPSCESWRDAYAKRLPEGSESVQRRCAKQAQESPLASAFGLLLRLASWGKDLVRTLSCSFRAALLLRQGARAESRENLSVDCRRNVEVELIATRKIRKRDTVDNNDFKCCNKYVIHEELPFFKVLNIRRDGHVL